jgi:hypothetical protein
MKAKKKLYKKGGAMVKSQDRAKKLVKKGKELIFDKAGKAAEEGKYKKADRLAARGSRKIVKASKKA